MLSAQRVDAGGRSGCDAVRLLAFAACDDELTIDEIAAIDSHLVACHACRERVARDATFVRVVRRAASLDAAPQSLRDRVAQILQSHAAENAST